MTVAIWIVIVWIIIVISEGAGGGEEGEADGEEGTGDFFRDAEAVFFEPTEDDWRVGRAIQDDGVRQADGDLAWFGRIGEFNFERGGSDGAGERDGRRKEAVGFGAAEDVVCFVGIDFMKGVVGGYFDSPEAGFRHFRDAGGVEGVRAAGPKGFKGEAGLRGQRDLLSGFGFPHL